jgi:tetratricopeptide (TPR) repeat protein
MPSVRAPHLILEAQGDELAFWYWRHAVDLVLWLEESETKQGLFLGVGTSVGEFPDKIKPEFQALSVIYTDPNRVVISRLTSACGRISEWLEQEDRLETALQYAELAARLSPTESERCSTAGRLCRRRRESIRGTMWFRRATQLSAYSGKHHFRDLSTARFGWANLALDLGNLAEAEVHATKAFRAALRCGRHGDAAGAYHTLATALIHQGRHDEAWVHARNALTSYPLDNPRFPALAHDIAFLWGKQGFFSDAADIYEMVLPTISHADERFVVLANIARAAAAAGDRLRYERAAREILRAADSESVVAHSVLYHLARAAINIGDWFLAARLAKRIPPQQSVRWAQMMDDLHKDIRTRSGGEVNVIPEYGSEIHAARSLLVKKLERSAGPAGGSGPAEEKHPMS